MEYDQLPNKIAEIIEDTYTVTVIMPKLIDQTINYNKDNNLVEVNSVTTTTEINFQLPNTIIVE